MRTLVKINSDGGKGKIAQSHSGSAFLDVYDISTILVKCVKKECCHLMSHYCLICFCPLFFSFFFGFIKNPGNFYGQILKTGFLLI